MEGREGRRNRYYNRGVFFREVSVKQTVNNKTHNHVVTHLFQFLVFLKWKNNFVLEKKQTLP